MKETIKEIKNRQLRRLVSDSIKIKSMMGTEGWEIVDEILRGMIFSIVGGIDKNKKIIQGSISGIKDDKDLAKWISRKDGLTDFYNNLRNIIVAGDEAQKQLSLGK